jgi:hypothetical protein
VKTRAVLLNRTGSVHRVLIDSNGNDVTACGQRYQRHVQVAPKQALVYSLAGYGDCWTERERQWQHFVEGTGS